MSFSRLFVFVLLVFLLAQGALAQNAGASRVPPRIGYVYPAGGQGGSSFRIAVGGQYLSGQVEAIFSIPGVTVEFEQYHRPLTQKEFNELRDKVEALQKRRAEARQQEASKSSSWSAEDEETLASLRKRLASGRPNRQANPALSETVVLKVSLPADAMPGAQELRLKTPGGISNPLVFCVGQLPEVLVDEVHAEPPATSRPAAQQAAVPRTETTISIPAVVNGQILQGGVDRLRFKASKGQKLVFAVNARALIPYLADAVPGWFQATLCLMDAKGRELAYDDDFRFHPDPVLEYQVREDGEYLLEIRDAIYRGREDFVYRVTIGEIPFITSIHPLGAPAGSRTDVEVRGWNLGKDKIPLDAGSLKPGRVMLSVKKGELNSNQVSFELGELPELQESEPNDEPGSAQILSLPCVVNGRIEKPDEVDRFRFDAKAGDRLVAEIVARRLGSPLDSQLRLVDSQGEPLGFNDDHEDKSSGLVTHHADSKLQATLPRDGTYYLELGDVQHQGSPAHAYRLELRRPTPDFELRLVPSSISLRAGESVPVTVHALRKDGFDGAIRLAFAEPVAALVLDGGLIPRGSERVTMTISSRGQTTRKPAPLSLVGEADINGRAVRRQVVPAEDMMQAFAYRHLVPSRSLLLDVLPENRSRPQLLPFFAGPLQLKPGKTIRLALRSPPRRHEGDFSFELNDPPAGLSIEKTVSTVQGVDIHLLCDAHNLKPGQTGNLLLSVHREITPKKKGSEGGKPQKPRKQALGYLQAIPFEIVSD